MLCWKYIVWVCEELSFKLQTLYTWKNLRFFLLLLFEFCCCCCCTWKVVVVVISFNSLWLAKTHIHFLWSSVSEWKSQHVSHCVSAFDDFWKSTENDYVSSCWHRYRFYVRFFLLLSFASLLCVLFTHSSETNISTVCTQDTLESCSVSKRAVSM